MKDSVNKGSTVDKSKLSKTSPTDSKEMSPLTKKEVVESSMTGNLGECGVLIFSINLKSLKDTFASMEAPNNGLVLLPKTIILQWNYLLFVCCGEWQGWKWIETWQNWVNVFKFWMVS